MEKISKRFTISEIKDELVNSLHVARESIIEIAYIEEKKQGAFYIFVVGHVQYGVFVNDHGLMTVYEYSFHTTK